MITIAPYPQFATKGCTTGLSYLDMPVTTREYITTASNYWSSVEYNATNCAICNFSNGTFNNNNRYNSNYVRPVADLMANWKASWFRAYLDCCKNKLHSGDCCEFRMKHWPLLYKLMVDVWDFNYTPSKSKTFCVTRPKVREIFAASFIDRIAQHWVINLIEPLLERSLIEAGDISYNCRKGYGTLRCVNDFSADLERVANERIRAAIQQASIGETLQPDAARAIALDALNDMRIVRIDILSFFMTIDKQRLIERLVALIDEQYDGPWKDHLLYLMRVIVMHRPQDNCERRGDLSLWKVLPSHKSLFCVDGMPIGNITSQQLANFVLGIIDALITKWVATHHGCARRFVDDIPAVVCSQKEAHEFVAFCREALTRLCGQTIHPDKIYSQPILHGLYFVGSIIKPYLAMERVGQNSVPRLRVRTYISNRTRQGLNVAARHLLSTLYAQPCIATLYRAIKATNSLNAYIGLMAHQRTFKIRSRLLTSLCANANKIFPPLRPLTHRNNYSSVHLTRKYISLCCARSGASFLARCEPSAFPSCPSYRRKRARTNKRR